MFILLSELIEKWDDLSKFKWNNNETVYDLLFITQRYNYSVKLAGQVEPILNYHNQACLSTWKCESD